MPSSKKYKAKRTAKGGKPNATLRHEAARQKKLHGTKTLSKMKAARKNLRKKLKIPKGSKVTGGHGSKKLASVVKKNKNPPGKKQMGPGKGNNYAQGGAKKHVNKSVAKKGKGYSGRKKKA